MKGTEICNPSRMPPAGFHRRELGCVSLFFQHTHRHHRQHPRSLPCAADTAASNSKHLHHTAHTGTMRSRRQHNNNDVFCTPQRRLQHMHGHQYRNHNIQNPYDCFPLCLSNRSVHLVHSNSWTVTAEWCRLKGTFIGTHKDFLRGGLVVLGLGCGVCEGHFPL